MIKKTITYEDYNGNAVSEDFYFNMTKLELLELEANTPGGFEAYLQKLSETTDGPEAYYLFKKIILDAYGQKSDDGKRFIKTKALREELEGSPALSELIIEFLENPQLAAEFVVGLLPKNIAKDIPTTNAGTQLVLLEDKADSESELQSLSKEELIERLRGN